MLLNLPLPKKNMPSREALYEENLYIKNVINMFMDENSKLKSKYLFIQVAKCESNKRKIENSSEVSKAIY